MDVTGKSQERMDRDPCTMTGDLELRASITEIYPEPDGKQQVTGKSGLMVLLMIKPTGC
jgi:hypothetical protein